MRPWSNQDSRTRDRCNTTNRGCRPTQGATGRHTRSCPTRDRSRQGDGNNSSQVLERCGSPSPSRDPLPKGPNRWSSRGHTPASMGSSSANNWNSPCIHSRRGRPNTDPSRSHRNRTRRRGPPYRIRYRPKPQIRNGNPGRTSIHGPNGNGTGRSRSHRRGPGAGRWRWRPALRPTWGPGSRPGSEPPQG